MDKIFGYIDQNRDRFVQELITLVRQPSISAQGQGLEACANLLCRMMEDLGIRTEILPMGGPTDPPLVFGELSSPQAAKSVLVYGHYDVQPPEPLEAWTTPPFEPAIRNGRLYGRGTADNKGQLLAQLKGLEAVLKVLGESPINVKFIFDPEEEIGSPRLNDFITTTGDKFKADFGYASDGPLDVSGRPRISFGNRGLLYLEVNHQEARRDLHSGHFAEAVPNPNWRMIAFLNTLKDQNGRVAIEGFYDQVAPPTDLERAALSRIPFDQAGLLKELGLKKLFDENFMERTTAWPSLNICGYASGYGGEGAKTIIPSRTRVKIDVRLVMNQKPTDIYEKFRRHMERHGCGDFDLKVLSAVSPRKTNITHPMAEPLVRAARAVYQKEPIIVPSGGGTLPLAFFEDYLKMPLVCIPYANHDEMNHAPNENLDLDLFIMGVKCSAAVLCELGRLA